jgi:hypothetical protein
MQKRRWIPAFAGMTGLWDVAFAWGLAPWWMAYPMLRGRLEAASLPLVIPARRFSTAGGLVKLEELHNGAAGHPVTHAGCEERRWIPAFAGMTDQGSLVACSQGGRARVRGAGETT